MGHYLLQKLNWILPFVVLAILNVAPVPWNHELSAGKPKAVGMSSAKLAGTRFWISPKDDVVVIVLQQFMPYFMLLNQTIKPSVYAAITD